MRSVPGPYPPPHHILSDLGLRIDRRELGALRVEMPVQEAGLCAGGGLRAGLLGVALDVFAGNLAVDAARPDWALTSELALHRLAPLAKGTLVVTGHALRAGRTQLVVEASGTDADGERPRVFGTLGFTRVPRREDTPRPPEDPPDVFRFGDPHRRLTRPLLDALGVREVDAAEGRLEMPLSDYVKNSVGALQGGVVTCLVDAAAAAKAGSLLGTRACVDDLAVRFLALAREGPVHARTALLRRGDGAVLLRVELRDAGVHDRVVTVATAVARAA